MFLVLAITIGGVDLVAQGEASIYVGCVDYVARFVLIPGCWIVWIVWLGYVDSGCVDLVAGFVFLVCWVCYRWVMWIPV